MGNFATELGHLKSHVPYPANKAQVIAACNQMSEGPHEDGEWMAKVLPEGTYKNATDVLSALLTKV